MVRCSGGSTNNTTTHPRRHAQWVSPATPPTHTMQPRRKRTGTGLAETGCVLESSGRLDKKRRYYSCILTDVPCIITVPMLATQSLHGIAIHTM